MLILGCGLASMTASVAVAFFYLLAAPPAYEQFTHREFSSSEWIAAGWKPGMVFPPEDRIAMVDALIGSKALDNRSRQEVRHLLGADDSEEGTGYGRSYFTNWDAVYWLGKERRAFTGIDSEWLVVRYGDDERVSEYELVND